MQREPTAREQLATLLWGDRFDTQARQSLRQCLLSLRGELVGLKAQLFSTDAHEFAALAEKGADLERALVHYRGEFLAACVALGVDRSSIRYRSCRPDDASVRARLRELASVRRRFGYRRLYLLMSREGLMMNHKKFRLYREERLQVRRRGGSQTCSGCKGTNGNPAGR
jgi:hypothetical protein